MLLPCNGAANASALLWLARALCGSLLVQVGLNGVDNGSMRFHGVRVPREALLDRFASVDRMGAYSSPFSASRRFAATLGELTGGRVGLTCSSLGILKVALSAPVLLAPINRSP